MLKRSIAGAWRCIDATRLRYCNCNPIAIISAMESDYRLMQMRPFWFNPAFAPLSLAVTDDLRLLE